MAACSVHTCLVSILRNSGFNDIQLLFRAVFFCCVSPIFSFPDSMVTRTFSSPFLTRRCFSRHISISSLDLKKSYTHQNTCCSSAMNLHGTCNKQTNLTTSSSLFPKSFSSIPWWYKTSSSKRNSWHNSKLLLWNMSQRFKWLVMNQHYTSSDTFQMDTLPPMKQLQ